MLSLLSSLTNHHRRLDHVTSLQTFMIPGSIFLSILSGYLYPVPIALTLVCLSSGIGATGCYIISMLVGRPLVNKYMDLKRTESWRQTVDSQRDNLFFYILFLRITPFLPNWFVNIVAPLVDIPISTFFIATAIGVGPLSYIAVSGGTMLKTPVWSWSSVITVTLFALMSMAVPLYKKYFKKEEIPPTKQE